MRKGGPIFSPSCLLRLRSEIILTNVIKHLTYFKSTRVFRIFVMNRGPAAEDLRGAGDRLIRSVCASNLWSKQP